jgi:predicted nucleic acid-binding protein
MKPMKGKVFADSNILLYLLGNDERKKNIAKTILKANPVITIQVISENVNVLTKKFKQLSLREVSEHINMLLSYCIVKPLDTTAIEKAFGLKEKYGFQWYDCTILSGALLEDCTIIYSEDMQHEQIIEGRLRIINPFL